MARRPLLLTALAAVLAGAVGCGGASGGGPPPPSAIGPPSTRVSVPAPVVGLTPAQARAIRRANVALAHRVAGFVPADRRCVAALTTPALTGYAACILPAGSAQAEAAAATVAAVRRGLDALRAVGAGQRPCARALAVYAGVTRRLAGGSAGLAAAARRGDDRTAFARDRGVYPAIRAWSRALRPLAAGCGRPVG
jgi:hypothetical protein